MNFWIISANFFQKDQNLGCVVFLRIIKKTFYSENIRKNRNTRKNVFSSFSNSFVIKKTTFSCVFVMKRPHFLPIPFFSEKFSIGKRYLKNVKSTFIGLCEKIKTANFPRGKGVTIENKAVTLPPNHKRSSMYNP